MRMPKGGTLYKVLLESRGLKQLDVYRFKGKEVIRVRLPSGEVKLVELPGFRENMKPEEFLEYVLSKVYPRKK